MISLGNAAQATQTAGIAFLPYPSYISDAGSTGYGDTRLAE
jgi:hypothetical protein